MEIQAIGRAVATLAQSQSANESASTSKANQPETQKAGGAPPAGGGAKPIASSDNTSSSSSSIAKVYDKRDANQDGIVSYQEELLYSLKHPPEETQDQSAVSTSQIQAGLNAYQQGQQVNGSLKGLSLFSI
jgi:hypothetical protein